MKDYQRGKIYKIYSSHTDQVYIGSTVEPYISNRFSSHRCGYKTWLNGGQKKWVWEKKPYCSSYEIIKYGDAQIELVENYPCNLLTELIRREIYYIHMFKSVNAQKYVAIQAKILKTEHDRVVKNKEDVLDDIRPKRIIERTKLQREKNKKEKIRLKLVRVEMKRQYDKAIFIESRRKILKQFIHNRMTFLKILFP